MKTFLSFINESTEPSQFDLTATILCYLLGKGVSKEEATEAFKNRNFPKWKTLQDVDVEELKEWYNEEVVELVFNIIEEERKDVLEGGVDYQDVAEVIDNPDGTKSYVVYDNCSQEKDKDTRPLLIGTEKGLLPLYRTEEEALASIDLEEIREICHDSFSDYRDSFGDSSVYAQEHERIWGRRRKTK